MAVTRVLIPLRFSLRPFGSAWRRAARNDANQANLRGSFDLSWPAKAGHPVIAAISVFTGSSACADDDSAQDGVEPLQTK
jgi:hypothetical protein